ncbi:glycine zipper 2TM domain-containing protein [Luteibacter sp. PPL201]|uniref:Glycine zipper 2TM domain-containing protein n=1 Tax=Luteibacter sahnii TaxID=3021977 RepID=A0ABT6BBW3_9GAMM|nr:glycine zipper 2TM domain-containing protein [Luteibacter sp. PPL193]MDY1547368.1 glycine zipper 2TM domain-containing protein [Luteibacter sp. PPL193]
MARLLIPALFFAVFATGAVAQDGRYGPPPPQGPDDNTHFGWADVLRVDPVYGVSRVETPRQECYDQPVVRRESSGGSAAGTILGAVVGGVLGNTVGKGDGRKAATVAGALAGGVVGNNVSRDDRTYEGTETRCRDFSTVSEQRRIAGYDVEYRYRGEVYVSRLNYDPGERLRVRVSVSPAD